MAPAAGIAEMVGLVDNHGISQLEDTLKPLWVLARAVEVGVVKQQEVGKIDPATEPADMRKPTAQMGFPYALPSRFRSEDYHPFALVQHETLH